MVDDPERPAEKRPSSSKKQLPAISARTLKEPSCVYACPHDGRASRRPAHIFCRYARPGFGENENGSDATRLGHRIAGNLPGDFYCGLRRLYAFESPQGPRGGSAGGLSFGIIGFCFMIFAALLGARKRVPRGESVVRKPGCVGHLWLGFLRIAMIVFSRWVSFRERSHAS